MAARRPVNVKNKVGLLGDSNFNKIGVPEMNSHLKKAQCVKYSYSGATSLHLQHYCDILLSERLDTVFIHAGTNDIWGRNKRNVTSQQIAEDIINIGLKCRETGVKTIYISSIFITHVPNSNRIRGEVNNLLKLLCYGNNFTYINNDFLTLNDLEDQVHLNWDGRRKYVNNIINILNH